MRKNSTLVIMPVMLAMLFLIPSQVTAADQPYMGGYLRGSVVTTSKVLLDVNFVGTNPSQIPSGKWVGGIASVAGGDGLSTTGWMYQSMASLDKTNDVIWSPQAWSTSGDGQNEWYYDQYIGKGHYVSFYQRMHISSGNIVFKAYVYQGFLQRERDAPIVYTWSHSIDDDNFLVGRRTAYGKTFKHFQFGVESNAEVSETAWKVLNNHASYYTGGNWRYLPGYVTKGKTSHITWMGIWALLVGGLTYSGVNKDYVGADMVCWKRTGTTIGDGTKLWSESGIVSDSVSKPYQ